MNIKNKLAYVAFALSLTTSASFGQTSLFDLASDFSAFATSLPLVSSGISAATPSAFTTYTNTATAGDLAVINQDGATSGNDAYIIQTVGTGTPASYNIASISQIGNLNKAYIDQTGEGNVALIHQGSDGNLGYITQAAAVNSLGGIDQSSATASAGYITQTGTTHSALIIQQ